MRIIRILALEDVWTLELESIVGMAQSIAECKSRRTSILDLGCPDAIDAA